MKRLAFLSMAVMALLLAASAAATKLTAPATLAAASPQPATIWIQELHRQVDASSLSAPEIVGP